MDAILTAYSEYLGYLISEVTLNYDYKPWYQNYFYGLIFISLIVWSLEMMFPWRKRQSAIRKDFWLDGFYMFFNFFIFGLAITGLYAALGSVFGSFGITLQSLSLIDLTSVSPWAGLLIFFILNDFVQWFTHVLLHRFPIFWRFHRVHHSVVEMGFAAHLRYHWMENLLYKPLKTLAVMLVGGFEPEQAFFVHFIAITIGHLNHANVRITWGPLKYLINNSVMHLYHHAKELPNSKVMGVNFGISLSLWDYIFKTNYIPQSEDGTYELGFDGIEKFPKHSFFKQLLVGFGKD
ncbi:MAG: sterol desaturase/sphingolipid hydroxylase (fatty acid hydroxylase superfamily) [Granulosicoccus sp.]|jgi:sterol desaturase/sphingolipid hydroxylase (fatty acid hydroxylase superfamily)